MDKPNKGQIIFNRTNRAILLKEEPHLESTSYFATEDNVYIARGVIGNNRKTIGVTVIWFLTPAYKLAINQLSDADRRNDEVIKMVLEDEEGAAEWEYPLIIREYRTHII